MISRVIIAFFLSALIMLALPGCQHVKAEREISMQIGPVKVAAKEKGLLLGESDTSLTLQMPFWVRATAHEQRTKNSTQSIIGLITGTILGIFGSK